MEKALGPESHAMETICNKAGGKGGGAEGNLAQIDGNGNGGKPHYYLCTKF